MKRLMTLLVIVGIVINVTGCAGGFSGTELRRSSYCNAHDLSYEIQKMIRAGQLSFGMTKEEVTASWGRPDRRNTSTRAYGTSAQWVYDKGNFKAQYIYFRDGVVTSWQETN